MLFCCKHTTIFFCLTSWKAMAEGKAMAEDGAMGEVARGQALSHMWPRASLSHISLRQATLSHVLAPGV
jgi:hypothetical protein